MTAQDIAKALVSGEAQLIIAAGMVLAVYLLRRYDKVPDMNLRQEALTLLGMATPLVATSMVAGADWRDTLATVLPAMLVAMGFNSQVPLGGAKPSKTEAKPQ